MKRVIQFSTGNVGKHALPMIIERPGLQLVGLHAHGPDKVGRDAAQICGRAEPTGVIATDDIDVLIARIEGPAAHESLPERIQRKLAR